MRKQYHFWPATSGSGRFDAWDVDDLIRDSDGLPVEPLEIATVGELDTDYWGDGSGTSVHTVREIVGHTRFILDVDPGYPVILGPDGRVMDGMHRIARALLEDIPSIPSRRFTELPPPAFTDVRPDELSYER